MKQKDKKKKQSFAQLFPLLAYIAVGIVGGLLVGQYLNTAAWEELEPVVRFLYYLGLFVGVYAVVFVCIIIHESGHLVFGLATGYGFVSFRVGTLTLMRDREGNYRLGRLKMAGTGGQCLLSPPDLVEGKMPVVLYNMGGCIFNAIAGALLLGLYFIIGGPLTVLRLLLIMGGLFNFAVLLTNGIPLKNSLIANDGANTRSVCRDPRALRALWLQLKISQCMAYGQRLGELPEAWFADIDDEDMRDPITAAVGVMACNRLMDQGRIEEADALMEHYLAIKDSAMLGLHRQLLICERMFCEMVGQNRPAVIDEMRTPEVLKFIKMMRTSPSIIRLEYTYAILTDFDRRRADDLLAQFERCARHYPYPQDIESERELIALAQSRQAVPASSPSRE